MTTIERCEKETGHAQAKNSHFCRCTHVMYDSEKPDARKMPAMESMTERERQLRGAYEKVANDAAAEIHMAEVQRDQARDSAKAIILDLIEEHSASELKCWLCGPHQFKLAVLARLKNWK